MSVDWSQVADKLDEIADHRDDLLDQGQRATVCELARRIRGGARAALLADEVGMGKTRIAVALIQAVRQAGGRSAIVLPPGLGSQWQKELNCFDRKDTTLLPLRSYDGFIAGFMSGNEVEGSERKQNNHKKRLKERRLLRELPQKGWADEKILMISHSFASMRFQGGGSGAARWWRRELLPYVTKGLEARRRNLRRSNFKEWEIGWVHGTRRAADFIVAQIQSHDPSFHLRGDHETPKPKEYRKDIKEYRREIGEYRKKILRLIGFGIGQFDLIVIDEAHKARGEDSSLSRILGPVCWESSDAFRFGMTATPVELDPAQWIDTLGRIHGRADGHDFAALGSLQESITAYVGTVARVQTEVLTEDLTQHFEKVANRFQQALRPFVLRRDKRDDPEYSDFKKQHGDYRQIEPVLIPSVSQEFSRDWLRRFCAAEALSFLPQNDPMVKRARISVAQGFGFDLGDAHHEDISPSLDSGDAGANAIWLDACGGPIPDNYDHPSILAAVRLIESYTERQEKVLVFGKFIESLDALTRLLDARAMLRHLSGGRHWPARGITAANEPAVRAAMADPKLWSGPAHIEAVNQMLNAQYATWATQRRAMLKRLHLEVKSLSANDPIAAVLEDFLYDPNDALEGDIGALLEALDDQRGDEAENWTGQAVLDGFRTLLSEMDGDEDAKDKADQFGKLHEYLRDFSGREGNFARMMYGKTTPLTRRLLQAAFNRAARWPMVLVAQSLVGREGLNLHEACRTVVLFHPEWNPAIVEQQIGRVDRKQSLWLKDLREWTAKGQKGDPPRIRIHSIIITGTYSDHNWQVLTSRWKDLRAQLHGEVLPHRAYSFSEKTEWKNRIAAAAPNFAPPPREGRADT